MTVNNLFGFAGFLLGLVITLGSLYCVCALVDSIFSSARELKEIKEILKEKRDNG